MEILVLWFLLLLTISCAAGKKYLPTWSSIDSRPLPKWYDQSKFGIFIHWGVYSVPSFGNEWFWNNWMNLKYKDVVDFMKANYPPNFRYQDFAKDFTAELFDPNQWADIFNASGAKYVVFTAKHHEGFCNWKTKYSFNWNSVDVGPNRDLVGELASAIRNKTNLHFGLYYSLYEWFNPLWKSDEVHLFLRDTYPRTVSSPQLRELVNSYHPEIIWSDGDVGLDTYWNSTGFLAWLYNDSPVRDTVVVNDRWGALISCHHGGYFTCQDSFLPDKLQKRKWESCNSIDKYCYGYRRNVPLSNIYTMEELIQLLVRIVSFGGNLLLNVGPTHDGRIVPIFEERLREMGKWLQVNGEAIYDTKPWRVQNDTITPDVWYTSSTTKSIVYAIFVSWPKSEKVQLSSPQMSSDSKVSILGLPGYLRWDGMGPSGLTFLWPRMSFNHIPCSYAWVVKLENVF